MAKAKQMAKANLNDHHNRTLDELYGVSLVDDKFHWGINSDEIKPSFNINAITKDIELAINGVDQVIEQGWEEKKGECRFAHLVLVNTFHSSNTRFPRTE